MPAVAIEFDDVGLTFAPASAAPTIALQAVSCGFEPGKVTALIGPSGCGKSTLLQIARGLLDPSSGQLRFLERSNGKTTERPAMSTVWQAFNLFPWLTVMDNVAFGLDLAGVPKRDRDARARQAIAAVDLYRDEDLFGRVASLADYWADAVHSLKGLPNVIDLRNIGLVGAIELAPRGGKPGARAYDAFVRAFEAGILIRVTADIIALSPPLIVERPQIDQLIGTLANVLRQTP